MEITVYSLHTSANEVSLFAAFCRKIAVENVWGECAHVLLKFGKHTIEVTRESPAYRVLVRVPFVAESENDFEYFATFEDAMNRVEEAYSSGFLDVELEKYRKYTYKNGARWVSVG